MAIINQATGELHFKIVYHGAVGAGRRTNLIKIFDQVASAQEKKGGMFLATSTRTVSFDFCPSEPLSIKGFKTKFRIYAVPGEVIYSATRQLVLRGVDGIVFVIDSRYERMASNLESFTGLEEHLAALKLTLTDVPYVFQYNKRDLPGIAPVEYMEFLLNNRDTKAPSVEACAHDGVGVMETFNTLLSCILLRFERRNTSRDRAV